MKIRIAINSNFLSRKIRGATYGMLLLLTFFVPQFAKTQDQLNAARLAQADSSADVSLGQNQVDVPVNKSQEAYAAKAPEFDARPAVWTTAPTAAQPALIASLSQTALPASAETVRESARFSPAPVIEGEDVTQTVAPVAAQPIQVASLTPAIIPEASAPVPEIIVSSPARVVIVEEAQRTAASQPLQVASLNWSFLPAAAQSTPNAGSPYSGEYITADFVNVPLVDFFRMMSNVSGINIILDPALNGNLTGLSVKNVPWDNLFEVVLKNHGLDKKFEGAILRIARKSTLQEEAKQEEELRKANMLAGELETRVKRLNYAKASELKDLIADQKTARGTVVVDDRTNSLVLTDLPAALENMFRLIESLDFSQPQVEIETRIISSTRNFARDIGVQFGFVQGNSQRVTAGGSNTAYLQPGPANRPMGETSSSSDSPGISPGLGDTGGNLNVNLPARSPFGGIGVAVGNIFDTFLLDAAITAGESKGSARLISQPKVVVQNNSPGIITNGMRIPVTVNSDNTITIQFFDAALALTVTPQITYDGNVILDLDVTNNKADFSYVSSGGVPTIRTSETRTRILVSDGGTTMLGGILVEDDSTNEDRVPGLGSLPILGNLFRRTGSIRDTQEILFFVTPRILR